MDWKARLYSNYTSQHVMQDPAEVGHHLQARKPYVDHLIKQHAPSAKTARILDLGCGYGAILSALEQHGYTNLTGVDVSSQQVAVARTLVRSKVAESDLMPYLRSLTSGSEDMVIAFDVLEHFTRPELLDLMFEMARVLAPGGRLLIHSPNGEGIFWGAIRYGDLTHELAFTRGSMNQLANATGLRLVSVHEDRPVPHGLLSSIRAMLWSLLTANYRLLRMAETGCRWSHSILSQNLLAVMEKP